MSGKTVPRFDWEEGKREKCEKHGVTIDEIEIEGVIVGEPAIGPNAARLTIETRFRSMARASSAPNVFLAVTWRERDGVQLIRPASTRYMHAKEVQRYERG